MPLTVCTPDQIFKFVFKYPGYEADVATFSYSRIIIDEIQAYSPELLAVLIYGLQMIHKAGGRFAITKDIFDEIVNEIKETAKNFRESAETGQKEALRMKLLMLKNEMNYRSS